MAGHRAKPGGPAMMRWASAAPHLKRLFLDGILSHRFSQRRRAAATEQQQGAEQRSRTTSHAASVASCADHAGTFASFRCCSGNRKRERKWRAGTADGLDASQSRCSRSSRASLLVCVHFAFPLALSRAVQAREWRRNARPAHLPPYWVVRTRVPLVRPVVTPTRARACDTCASRWLDVVPGVTRLDRYPRQPALRPKQRLLAPALRVW